MASNEEAERNATLLLASFLVVWAINKYPDGVDLFQICPVFCDLTGFLPFGGTSVPPTKDNAL